MIVYADASALVKRYVAERGSDDVIALTAAADIVATSLVTRAEVAAALARAVRLGALDEGGGRRAQRRFSREWLDLARVPPNEALVARAETLAWDHGLRGYNCVQLASALT
ncbi:MAG: type II toxin-antitoxin system VapC family toxin, partial [Solirubrobacteraceae bacterium]